MSASQKTVEINERSTMSLALCLGLFASLVFTGGVLAKVNYTEQRVDKIEVAREVGKSDYQRYQREQSKQTTQILRWLERFGAKFNVPAPPAE